MFFLAGKNKLAAKQLETIDNKCSPEDETDPTLVKIHLNKWLHIYRDGGKKYKQHFEIQTSNEQNVPQEAEIPKITFN